METIRNTVTRAITLRLTEEELKRAIADALGPITVELDQWDLTGIELGDTRLDLIDNPGRVVPGVDIDFTFQRVTKHPNAATADEEAGE